MTTENNEGQDVRSLARFIDDRLNEAMDLLPPRAPHNGKRVEPDAAANCVLRAYTRALMIANPPFRCGCGAQLEANGRCPVGCVQHDNRDRFQSFIEKFNAAPEAGRQHVIGALINGRNNILEFGGDYYSNGANEALPLFNALLVALGKTERWR